MPTPLAILLRLALLSSFFLSCLGLPAAAQNDAGTGQAGAISRDPDSSTLTLKTTVRRVVLDVVVTDSQGNAVPGLTKEDFSVAEDGQPQSVLSFESNGFGAGLDYVPPKLPAEPANTFVNLPATPEKGPLYVLLYDLVNMDNEDQMAGTANQHDDQIRGRQQLVKFIQSKPEGARFAIFVWSDGLHMVQGFTSDKALLYAAIDPQGSRPHVPKLYLMGENVGRADVHASIEIFNQIGSYLDGLPGRKNLIWFSGTFPLSLYPSKDEGPDYNDQVKRTLNLLARNQIAIYPVDVRGVVSADWHGMNGITQDGTPVSDRNKGAPAAAESPGTQSAAAKRASAGPGQSLIMGSYSGMDEIARLTGGRAFYSSNDVSASLIAATETGASFYTLTYAPTNRSDDRAIRSIKVELAKKGYRLAYRRTYYGADTGKSNAPVLLRTRADGSQEGAAPDAPRRMDDTLDAYMKHGAPAAHQLIFAAHVRAVGAPAKGTAEQMLVLASQPAYARSGRKNTKALAPIPLQSFAIDYTVMAHQLRLQESHLPMNLELAAAAYDSEGVMLTSVVNVATGGGQPATAPPAKVYRAQQEMAVPLAAATIRIAVQDANTGRVGAMEIKLPLASEDQSVAAQ